MTAAGYEARPDVWVSSGRGVVGASEVLGAAVDGLCHGLAGGGACWGSDDIGRAFFNGGEGGAGYGASRDAVLAGLADMVNVVRATGGLLIVSGHTYKVAEEASTVGSALPAGADKGAVAASSPYRLPEVTEGFPTSDPPPPGLVRMLFFVETLVGGCQWPDGSVDGLMGVARAWRAAAYSVRLVAEEVRGHARVVTSANAGEATMSFASFAEALQGGGDAGGLLWLASACEGLAGSVENLIRQKNAARLQFTLSLEFLVATWALAMAISVITGGGSIAAATATTRAEGLGLKAFLRAVVKGVGAGAWFSGGLDLAGQYSRVHYGLQEGFDGGEFFKAVGEGAVAGGVMGAGGGWIGMGRTEMTKALSGWMRSPGLKGAGTRFLVAGTTGTAGNVAAQAAFEKGHVDWGQAAAFGFGMAGIEGVKDVGRHAAAQLTATPHPGDGPTPGHTPPGDMPPGDGPPGGDTGGQGRALPGAHPTVSQDGIPNPRTYPHYSDRGVGYDLQAQPGDHQWNDPTQPAAHPAAETPTTSHTPSHTTDLATDPVTPPPATNIPHYDITSVGRDTPAAGTDHGVAAGPLPAVALGMDNAAHPGGSRPNVLAVPEGRTPVPSHGDGPVAGPVHGPEPRPVIGATGERPIPPADPATGMTDPATPVRTATNPTNPAVAHTDTAHRALTEARQIVAPDALLLQDGSVRLTDRTGRTIHIPEDVLRQVEHRLTGRAADGATVERLRAEAAAWLGAEIARSGHQPPVEGALDALQRLGAHSPDNVATAAALSREVGGADPTRRPLAGDHPAPPDPTLRPHLLDGAADNVVERARSLAADAPDLFAPDHAGAHGAGGALARDPHVERLSFDEVRSALDRLRPSDFGRGVTGWRWGEDGTTLHIETEAWGTRPLRVVIEEMPESLSALEHGQGGEPAQLKIAPWAMSREAAEAARLSPEEIGRAGQVLPQVLLHGITDTVQRAAATEARSGQGVVRRFVSDVRSAVRNDGQVHRLINDHRYLSREWRDATDATERARVAQRIRQVGQDLRTAGQVPPEPPWIGGADGVIPGHEIPTPRVRLMTEVRGLADALGKDVATLQEQIATHLSHGMEAKNAAEAAEAKALKAAGEHDRGAYERGRDAMDEVESQLREVQRHQAIADKYQEALNEAYKTRTAYQALLNSLERMETEPQSQVMARVSADAHVLLATEGRAGLTAYERLLDKVLSPDIVTPDAVLASTLPLRSEVTATANRLLADGEVAHTFSPVALENGLRAEFRNLISKDGALLPVGEDGTQLRTRMRLNHLVEVLNPAMRPGETIAGDFIEGGQWNGATANHSASTGYELDLARLSQVVLPDHNPTLAAIRAALKLWGPSFEVDRGTGWSETANDLYDARSGAVVNIRDGRVTVVEGVPEYELSIVYPDGRETPVTRVTVGAHDDATTAHVLVSDSHTLDPPKETAQLPVDQRQQIPLPHHAVIEMPGLERLFDKSMKSLAAENISVSDGAREQLRRVLTVEPKDHLRAMTGEYGPPRVIPGADLIVRLKATLDVSKVDVMPASTVDWVEQVEVGFIGTTGSDTYNVSTGGSSQVPVLPSTGAFDVMPGPGQFDVRVSGKVGGSRSVTHTETVNIGGVTIPVTVARHVAHTEGVTFREGAVVVEAHFYSIKDNRVLPTVVQDVSGTLRFEESDAYRYGLPVDAAALAHPHAGVRPDGSPVLRDDPVPGAPPGREAGLPSWIGDEPGQLRGAGHLWASEITGVTESLREVWPKLEELGVVSPVDANGLPVPSAKHPDRIELITQTTERRKVEELPGRLLADYGQAAQKSGIITELKHLPAHGAPETYRLRTYIEQHFTKYEHEGVDTSKQLIKLGIASESAGETVTRAVTWNGGGGVGAGHRPPAHVSGAEEGAGADYGRNHTWSTSESRTDMVNNVSISESAVPLSSGYLPHTVHQVVEDSTGRTLLHVTHEGRARIGVPVDWLPETDPQIPAAHPASEETRPTSSKVLDQATAQQMDPGDIVDRVAAKLPKGMRLPGGVATFLSEQSLRTHMDEWRGHGYETSVTVDPHGLQPKRLTLVVKGEVGPSEHVQAVDLVDGKINLTIEGVTSTESGSGGWKVTGSASGSGHHGADAALTDGGRGDAHKGSGTSTSQSRSESHGRERLNIGVDPDLVRRTTAHLDIEIRDPVTGTSEHVAVDAPMIYTVPESAALELYARGEMPLPLHHMADVMQRFLDGNLVSDPKTVARLVDPYLTQVGEAARAGEVLPELAADHTPDAFADKVLSVLDVGQDLSHGAAEQRASRELPPAHELAATEYQVAVADHYQHAMATSLFHEVELTLPDGTTTDVLGGVYKAVAERSPAAWTVDPTLRQRLSARFAGPRWEGFIDNMLDPWGFDRDLRVRVDTTGRSELLNLRLETAFGDDAVVIGTTEHVVPIFQDYGYRGGNRSEGSSGDIGGDVGGSDGSAMGGADGSVGTAKSKSVGGSEGEMLTRLKRLRWFDAEAANAADKGTLLVKQSISIKIEADQRSLQPGKTAGEPEPSATGPVTVELKGHVVRMIPARAVRPVEVHPAGAELSPAAETPPATPERVPDPRPVRLPGSKYYVEWVEAAAPRQVLRDTFVELLGKGSEGKVTAELARKWSALARHAPTNFERMIGGEGYPIRIRFGEHEATAVVHLDMSDLEIGGVGGAEVSQVDRSDKSTGWSVTVGHVSPVSGSLHAKDAVTGFGMKQSAGAQASESVSDNSGSRIETSEFSETNRAATGRAAGTFRIDFQQGRHEVHRTAEGEVHLTLAGPELDAARAAQEAGDPQGATWDLDPRPERPWHPFVRQKWEVVDADPARPSAALTQAQMEARLGNREVWIEVRTEGGETHRYHALRDGTLRNADGWSDGGFAGQFSGMHETLVALADRHQIDLRRLFERSPVPGTLADKVRAELTERGVTLPPETGRAQPGDDGARGQHGRWRGGIPGEGISAGGGFGAGGA